MPPLPPLFSIPSLHLHSSLGQPLRVAFLFRGRRMAVRLIPLCQSNCEAKCLSSSFSPMHKLDIFDPFVFQSQLLLFPPPTHTQVASRLLHFPYLGLPVARSRPHCTDFLLPLAIRLFDVIFTVPQLLVFGWFFFCRQSRNFPPIFPFSINLLQSLAI